MSQEGLPIEEVIKRANMSRRELCDIVNQFIEKKDYSEIFHYTSASGLLSILDNKCLRFTRWDSLNDYTENKYIHNLIDKGLDAYVEDSDFLSCMRQINEQNLKWKANPTKTRLENNLFIASFSFNGDALNLWTYYTKSAQSDGYCIGFKYGEVFCEPGLDIIMSAVVYDPHQQNAIISKILSLFNTMFHDLEKNDDTRRDLFTIMASTFEYIISDIGCFFKHPSFRVEEEIRAVVRVHDSKEHLKLPINIRQNRGMLIPYTELEFKKEHVTSVTVSPTLHEVSVLPGLYAMKQKLGMKFRILRSEIPLRSM